MTPERVLAIPDQTCIPGPWPEQGWVLYDGDCGFCLQVIRAIEGIITRYGWVAIPLQTPWIKNALGLTAESQQHELLKEMRLLTMQGGLYGGADALLALARRIWWLYPLYLVSFLPGVRPLLRAGYRWVAARRHCSAQGCSLPKK